MNRSVLKLAVPSILANITVPLVGMVDLAIAGRLGDASVIGAVAIATMLFDLLYWNMAFLRLGTGGLIAQAFGRGDNKEISRVFVQGISTAALLALFVLAIQYLFVKAAFLFIECTPQVQNLATEYFFIRIWAAPATISLYVFKGFFIGMQNAVNPMAEDVTVNISNVLFSIFFAFYAGLGFSGIAWGTLVAQYTGMVLAIALMVIYYRKLFHYIDLKGSIKLQKIKRFFLMNADLFVRSLSFLFIYAGLTSIAARYGDVALAVSSIMMKLMLLYSYFVDGFAYAGEALSGRYIGARDRTSLVRSIKVIFVWCMGIGIVSTIGYWAGGEWLFGLMATDPLVLAESARFLPWLLIMPLVSSVAFTWDGIFIGATATKAIRNSMMWAVAGFFASYYLLRGPLGVQSLWVGYMVHLVARTVYLSVVAKREVLNHKNFS